MDKHTITIPSINLGDDSLKNWFIHFIKDGYEVALSLIMHEARCIGFSLEIAYCDYGVVETYRYRYTFDGNSRNKKILIDRVTKLGLELIIL